MQLAGEVNQYLSREAPWKLRASDPQRAGTIVHTALQCVNNLKQLAFRHGLGLPMLSIHQDFVSPDPKERQKNIDHTVHCIELAARFGIPAIRLNSGRWGTIKSFDDLMKVKGDEPPIEGYTEEDALRWCIESIQACLPAAQREGVLLALENHWGLTTSTDTLYQMLVGYRSGDMWAPHLAVKEALETEAEHFVDCIRTGTTPISNGETGLQVVEILEAASRSIAAQGSPIPIKESPTARARG
jgi:hypothetical protein